MGFSCVGSYISWFSIKISNLAGATSLNHHLPKVMDVPDGLSPISNCKPDKGPVEDPDNLPDTL